MWGGVVALEDLNFSNGDEFITTNIFADNIIVEECEE